MPERPDHVHRVIPLFAVLLLVAVASLFLISGRLSTVISNQRTIIANECFTIETDGIVLDHFKIPRPPLSSAMATTCPQVRP